MGMANRGKELWRENFLLNYTWQLSLSGMSSGMKKKIVSYLVWLLAVMNGLYLLTPETLFNTIKNNFEEVMLLGGLFSK
jgi:hypothetical protein